MQGGFLCLMFGVPPFGTPNRAELFGLDISQESWRICSAFCCMTSIYLLFRSKYYFLKVYPCRVLRIGSAP